MVNFYRRSIPGAEETFEPLYCLLLPHKHSRKNVKWNEVAEASFIAVKQPLDPSRDRASGIAVGAVIQQTVGCFTQPIAFFSKNLTSAQRKWCTFDRELLAIFLVVKYFKYFLHD